MITNSGFTDGLIFRGVRKSLLQSFNQVSLFDLHGHGRRGKDYLGDENVFDILVGTAIVLLVKNSKKSKIVNRSDIFGSRESKYKYLFDNSFSLIEWLKINPHPNLFLFQDFDSEISEEYEQYMPFLNIWGKGQENIDRHNIYGSGIKTQQDEFAIAFNAEIIQKRIHELLSKNMTEDMLRSKYRLCHTKQWNFTTARHRLSNLDWESHICEVTYRPFDIRWTCYLPDIVTNPRPKVMAQLINNQKNIALLTTRQLGTKSWQHVFLSNHISDMCVISLQSREACHVFPLFQASEVIGKQNNNNLLGKHEFQENNSNFNKTFVMQIASSLGLKWCFSDSGNLDHGEIGPLDIFCYIYAVLYCPTYRARYSEFLKIDFPRIPISS
ncbi:hypothetical protein MEO93_29490, partial [Dolichospermum sp. ST_sed3]|nr:hypothetical protein [Dolichospermum sp. ST_sed3]